MAITFKLADDASEATIRRVLAALEKEGLRAERMFPRQARALLQRIYVLDLPDTQLKTVRAKLKKHGATVEYVEGSAPRRPL